MPITQIPTPVPSRADPANFAVRADAFLSALPTFVTEANTLATEVTNAEAGALSARNTAVSSASAAQINASLAGAFAGAQPWVSGSYPTGAAVYSPSNFRIYRRKSPGGSSVTDPAGDTGNWQIVNSVFSDENGGAGIGTIITNGLLTMQRGISSNDSMDNRLVIQRQINLGSSMYHTYSTATNSEAFGLLVADQADGGASLGNPLYTKYLVGSDGTHLWFGATAAAERMRIDAGGTTVKKPGGVNTTIFAWTDSANNTGKLSILPNGVGVGADGFLAFSTNQLGADTFNERMRIDASGNWILRNPPTVPATLTVNGDLTITPTSNTNVRISYRGSDGVTRVANIALA